MVGAVGDDDLGEEALAVLEAEGIDVAAVARLAGRAPPGVALIVVDARGENQIAVGLGRERGGRRRCGRARAAGAAATAASCCSARGPDAACSRGGRAARRAG